ncbi:hypothetical protein E2C01_086966 [Portunus trituberculatus]|uniref:Uncharacterized protein n=1 Tax=Portunus trituberculatus TaxID=210409 RepID=A0A5B7JC21_PORTR|nr:hypothetical protein [Portunus trituberculatus]
MAQPPVSLGVSPCRLARRPARMAAPGPPNRPKESVTRLL